MMRSKIRLMPLLLVALLPACTEDGIQEVRSWMDETRKNTRVEVAPLSEPKKFTPFAYASKEAVAPFDSTKLAMAIAKQRQSSGISLLEPDRNRRREPLEAYPLDTLRMVGTLEKTGLSYALIQADKTVFHAKVGNYVGQNFGMITNITETEVQIKEIVQDASGEWVERQAKLELQETKK